jgi:flavin reductase (DIM6/NTAB) family NADH-FMN oxidoreductase RutF
MTINVEMGSLSASERYHLLSQIVVPRPIAWVLTAAESGVLNLAPYSHFNVVSSDPPLVMIAVGYKSTGELKDTGVNVLGAGKCVIHIASYGQMASVQSTAAELLAGESEIDLVGLPTVCDPDFSLPRLADAPVALHAVLFESHVLGPRRQLVLYLEIKRVVLSSGVCALHADGQGTRIDPLALDPLARLGAGLYGRVGGVTKAPASQGTRD